MLISQGKSPEEAASVIEQKYGTKVTIHKLEPKQEQVTKETALKLEKQAPVKVEIPDTPYVPFLSELGLIPRQQPPHGYRETINNPEAIEGAKRIDALYRSFEPTAKEKALLSPEKPLHERVMAAVAFGVWGKDFEKVAELPEKLKTPDKAAQELAASGGLVGGTVGFGLGMATVVGKAAGGNVLGAGRDVVVGSIEWVGTAPARLLSGSPSQVGALAGETLAMSVTGKAITKAGEAGVKGVKTAAEYLTPVVKSGLEKAAYRASLAKAVIGQKVSGVTWRVTEPLYQRGILKPSRLEPVTEKPISQVLLEAAKTYRDIEAGVSRLRGEIRPLSRSEKASIEGRIAEQRLLEEPETLQKAAKTYKDVELGLSSLKGEIRPLSRSDVLLVESKLAEQHLAKHPERLRELAKSYRDVEEGVSRLEGDVRPLSRADIGLIESKIAEQHLQRTPEILLDIARMYKDIELGVSKLRGEIRPLSKSEIGLIESRLAEQKLLDRPEILLQYKKSMRDIELGISRLKGEVRPLPKSEIAKIEARFAEEKLKKL